jgi:hypothetical protein
MKYCLFILLALTGLSSFAQDEMPDTRKKNEGFAKIPDKDMRSDISTFNFAGVDEAVGKDPIKKITFTSWGQDYMVFTDGNIKATVKLANFDQSKHKLDFDEKYLIKIDRRTYYGGYPNVPKTYIKDITMTIGADTVAFPQTAYNDLFNLNLTYNDKSGTSRSANAIYVSKDGHRLYLYLFCKDKAGGYEVTYVIQDKKYVRRVLDYDFNL